MHGHVQRDEVMLGQCRGTDMLPAIEYLRLMQDQNNLPLAPNPRPPPDQSNVDPF